MPVPEFFSKCRNRYQFFDERQRSSRGAALEAIRSIPVPKEIERLHPLIRRCINKLSLIYSNSYKLIQIILLILNLSIFSP